MSCLPIKSVQCTNTISSYITPLHETPNNLNSRCKDVTTSTLNVHSKKKWNQDMVIIVGVDSPKLDQLGFDYCKGLWTEIFRIVLA